MTYEELDDFVIEQAIRVRNALSRRFNIPPTDDDEQTLSDHLWQALEDKIDEGTE